MVHVGAGGGGPNTKIPVSYVRTLLTVVHCRLRLRVKRKSERGDMVQALDRSTHVLYTPSVPGICYVGVGKVLLRLSLVCLV